MEPKRVRRPFKPEALAALRETMVRHVADGYMPDTVWLLHRHGQLTPE